MFDLISHCVQVSPSFFDAPCAAMSLLPEGLTFKGIPHSQYPQVRLAGQLCPKPSIVHYVFAAAGPTEPLQLTPHLWLHAQVCIVFCSPAQHKVLESLDKELAKEAMVAFNACIRLTLFACRWAERGGRATECVAGCGCGFGGEGG